MKKMFSVMTAMLMTASAALPLCTGAMPSQLYTDGMFADFTEIENIEWLEYYLGPVEKVFAKKHNDIDTTVYFVRYTPEYISFTTPDDTYIEKIADIVKDYDERLYFHSRPLLGGYNYYSIVVRSDDDLTAKEAKEIYHLLEDDVLSFDYYMKRLEYDQGSFTLLPAYFLGFKCEKETATGNALSEWLESSDIEAELVRTTCRELEYYQIIPDNELTLNERFDIAAQIAASTGLMPDATFLEDPCLSEEEIVDIMNAVDGDANCDDKVTVSDAVAVLQFIANKEKYPLTAQAKFNADIDGEDGLTGDDVRAIQMIDAAIWEET